MPEEVYEALNKAREEFYNILNEHDVNLDKLLN
jgi:hypothetical protein